MKKGWWIALSILLVIINVFLVSKVKDCNRNSVFEKIFIKGLKERVSIPSRESVLTFIIYFSNNECRNCIEEIYYWNKLFKDLKREEIFILGLIPQEEDIRALKEKVEIAFPVGHDRNGKIKNRFNISITPFKIIMDRSGKILYMSPSFSDKKLQESFYFEALELLREARLKEILTSHYYSKRK